MSQSRIAEVEYHAFLKILQRATDLKQKIDPADKEAWNEFVRKHNIPEAGVGVMASAGAMSGKTKKVILDGTEGNDGYYIYSSQDQYCLKYDFCQE